MSNRSRATIEASLRTTQRMQENLILELATLPDPIPEPVSPFSDGTIAIYFKKEFKNDARLNPYYYQYTAHKAADGLWYGSGVRFPNGIIWDELSDWIQNSKRYEIWIIDGLQPYDGAILVDEDYY